jgi:spermidine/putrescine transport system permease protein
MAARSWPFCLFVYGVYLFLYLPIIILIIFSFNSGTYAIDWSGFSSHWYSAVFTSREFWYACMHSFMVAGSAVLLSVTLGSLYVCYAGVAGLHNFSALFYFALAVPEIVLAAGLMSMFVFLALPFGLITLIVGHTVLGLSYVVPIVSARYNELDIQLMEASYDLGATRAQTLRYIVFPFLAPSVLAAALFVFIISLDDFVLAFFCAGPTAQTLPLYLFALIRAGASPMVNVIATIMLIISALIIALFAWVEFGERDR